MTPIVERSTVHISDDTGRIAMRELRNTDYDDDGSEEKLTRYIYSNHLQSASLELNEEAKVISYEEYHPYGTTAYQASNSEINAVAKRYRYTGKERDEESGLYYHGARYYVPWLGRWCASDPMESKFAGRTPYCYGGNNPVSYNDLDGRREKKGTQTQGSNDKGGGIGVGTKISWGMDQSTDTTGTTSLIASDATQVTHTVAPELAFDPVYQPSSELGRDFYYYRESFGWVNSGIGIGSPYSPDALEAAGFMTKSQAIAFDSNVATQQKQAEQQAIYDANIEDAQKYAAISNAGPAAWAGYTAYQLSPVSAVMSARSNFSEGNNKTGITQLGLAALPFLGKVASSTLGAVERNIVYRVIRADEDIAIGLAAKNPNATYDAAFHVSRGSKYSTQFISTTKELTVAQEWANKTGNRIVEIDLSMIEGEIFDLTNKSVLDNLIKHPIPRNLATKSREVLIKGFIPAKAINLLK